MAQIIESSVSPMCNQKECTACEVSAQEHKTISAVIDAEAEQIAQLKQDNWTLYKKIMEIRADHQAKAEAEVKPYLEIIRENELKIAHLSPKPTCFGRSFGETHRSLKGEWVSFCDSCKVAAACCKAEEIAYEARRYGDE